MGVGREQGIDQMADKAVTAAEPHALRGKRSQHLWQLNVSVVHFVIALTEPITVLLRTWIRYRLKGKTVVAGVLYSSVTSTEVGFVCLDSQERALSQLFIHSFILWFGVVTVIRLLLCCTLESGLLNIQSAAHATCLAI